MKIKFSDFGRCLICSQNPCGCKNTGCKNCKGLGYIRVKGFKKTCLECKGELLVSKQNYEKNIDKDSFLDSG